LKSESFKGTEGEVGSVGENLSENARNIGGTKKEENGTRKKALSVES